MADQYLQNFLNLRSQEILSKLNSSEQGLSSREAKKRLSLYGPNDLIEKRSRPVIVDAILHSVNPLVGILLVAAIFRHDH